jgi:hypothetical protein
MRRGVFEKTKRLAVAAIALMMIGVATLGQHKRPQQPASQAANMGKEMALITPALWKAGRRRSSFLKVADRLKLTDEQRTGLSEIACQCQKLGGDKKADNEVASTRPAYDSRLS